MYRYYLFFYYDYYPSGGMEDCVLKTNNFDDLEPFIYENYDEDWYCGTISYYDAVEDKTMYASINTDGDKWKIIGWE